MTEFSGIVFDCDGTLADTMPLHYIAWRTTLRKHGLEMTEDDFYAMGGWPTVKVTEHLLNAAGKLADVHAIAIEKEALFEANLRHVLAIDPVVNVAREQHGRIPLAVATGGFRHICNAILDHIGIRDLFTAVVTCEDVVRHKPEPDIFLEAARRIGVPPSKCLAYEDTEPGLAAARSAGMRVIDVRTFYKPRRVGD